MRAGTPPLLMSTTHRAGRAHRRRPQQQITLPPSRPHEEVRLRKRELAIVPREDDGNGAGSKRGRASWAALTGARA
jgi:hypothetical protein